MTAQTDSADLLIGVDVGGTKIIASPVTPAGRVLGRNRQATPRHEDPDKTVDAIAQAIADALDSDPAAGRSPVGIGIGIPGVVDVQAGRVVVAPNMSISGVELVSVLEDRFDVPVTMGNDVNCGILGEAWLGSARRTASSLGMFIGTGVGGGLVLNGRVYRGSREAAMEIGHMVMQLKGPQCGCGGRGCLEALASRSAIERKLREGVAAGEPTSLNHWLDGELGQIRSSILRRGLEEGDVLITRVLREVSEVLGHACINLRHVLDPEVIVLGGGVIEACSSFLLPTIQAVVDTDPLAGAREGGAIRVSALGDDAVVLGATAAVLQRLGQDPLAAGPATDPEYAHLKADGDGIAVGEQKACDEDFYIRVNGEVRKRKKKHRKAQSLKRKQLGSEEMEKICEGGPEVLLIGGEQVELTVGGRAYLRQRGIEHLVMPVAQAREAYNQSDRRRAIVFVFDGDSDG